MVGGGYFVRVTKRGYLKEKAEYNRANNKRVGVKVKAFQDSIIDDMVANPNYYEVPLDSVLYGALEGAIKPAVYNNYKALIDSPYIKNDSVQEMLILNKANKDTARIVEAELAQMKSNLNYVEKVLNKYEVLNSEYKKALTSNKLANRKQLLETVIKSKDSVNSLNTRLREAGTTMSPNLRIPDTPMYFTSQRYYDLDFFSEKMLRENRMSSAYEIMEEENRIAEENGNDAPHSKKMWVWTGIGKTTRHESNDGQTVDFDDYFTIINDSTGDVDEILYPCDPNGSPSNCAVCYCELETK